MAARSRPSKGMVVTRDPAPLRRALCAWYRRVKRDLPWRRTRDPYAIWVSEIMLQQTRVDVVAPYYHRFLQRFPDVATLARAPIENVLQTWAGLGYYRRARNLHAAARCVVAQHDGRVPDAPGALESLPGIGRYTAGAVRSIAFGEPAPILDGNVTRVFARVYGLDAPVESAPMRAQLWEIAGAWATGVSPGETNQGLMELGATVCTAMAPTCARCPLEEHCDARRTGRTATLPRPRPRPPVRRVALVAAIVRRRGRVLLVQRRSGSLLEAFWELPTGATPIASLGPRLAARFGITIDPPRPIGSVRHSILSNALEVEVVTSDGHPTSRITRTRTPLPISAGARTTRAGSGGATTRARTGATPLANLDLAELVMKWVRQDELAHLPLTTLSLKALRLSQRTPRTL